MSHNRGTAGVRNSVQIGELKPELLRERADSLVARVDELPPMLGRLSAPRTRAPSSSGRRSAPGSPRTPSTRARAAATGRRKRGRRGRRRRRRSAAPTARSRRRTRAGAAPERGPLRRARRAAAARVWRAPRPSARPVSALGSCHGKGSRGHGLGPGPRGTRRGGGAGGVDRLRRARPSSPVLVASRPTFPVIADLDGDGDRDAAVASNGADASRSWSTTAPATCTNGPPIAPLAQGPTRSRWSPPISTATATRTWRRRTTQLRPEHPDQQRLRRLP